MEEQPKRTEEAADQSLQKIRQKTQQASGWKLREQERLAHKLERVGSPSQNTEDFMAQMEMPDFDLTTESAKPVELLSDESCDDQSDSPKLPPVILISGMQQQERVEYSAVVEQLGGTVLDKQQFDPACTHLVVGQPTRNEKFLAAVATGRWVLHKSYFLACRQEGRFVREEDHEWGNPTMSSLLSNMNAQTNKLAAAAHKWRKRVQDMKKSDMDMLVSGVTNVLKPEFIAAHLTDSPAPCPEEFTPPEVLALKNRKL
nr:hypothetical protein BaRGS_030973 [Batillaria attramentaria]